MALVTGESLEAIDRENANKTNSKGSMATQID